jgi:hypothetical protein
MNPRAKAIDEIVTRAIETNAVNPQWILENILKRMSDTQLFAAYVDIFGKPVDVREEVAK